MKIFDHAMIGLWMLGGLGCLGVAMYQAFYPDTGMNVLGWVLAALGYFDKIKHASVQ